MMDEFNSDKGSLKKSNSNNYFSTRDYCQLPVGSITSPICWYVADARCIEQDSLAATLVWCSGQLVGGVGEVHTG